MSNFLDRGYDEAEEHNERQRLLKSLEEYKQAAEVEAAAGDEARAELAALRKRLEEAERERDDLAARLAKGETDVLKAIANKISVAEEIANARRILRDEGHCGGWEGKPVTLEIQVRQCVDSRNAAWRAHGVAADCNNGMLGTIAAQREDLASQAVVIRQLQEELAGYKVRDEVLAGDEARAIARRYKDQVDIITGRANWLATTNRLLAEQLQLFKGQEKTLRSICQAISDVFVDCPDGFPEELWQQLQAALEAKHG